MARHTRNRAARPTRRLGIQPLEARRCLAAVGFAEHPIGGHLLGGSSGMTVGDLNGDGHLDFISSRADLIGWRANDGLGNFGENRLVTTELERADYIIAGDVDGDGDNDVVAISRFWDEELAWFENRDGLGTFGPKQTMAQIDELAWSLQSGDLDGDGDLDLIRLGRSNRDQRYIEWYANVDGAGRFERQQLNSGLYSPVVIDLDHDGDQDIVSGNGWLENVDGQGQFVERPSLHENEANRIVIDDLDNNGRLDLIVSRSPFSAEWYEATDDPTVFEQRAIISSDHFNGDETRWYPGDVDGDGDEDLVVVEFSFAPQVSGVHWYELVGAQYLYRESIESGVGGDWSLIVTDLNGDLRDDVLYYPGNGESFDVREGRTSTTWQMYQSQSRTFGDPIPINDVFHPTNAMATADIDGDGDLDVIHTTADRGYFYYGADIAWIENLDGTHAFGRRSVVYTERFADRVFRQVWPGDIDGDGDVDIAATKSGEPVWFENLDGKGNFGGEQRIEGVPSDAAMLVHDLDNDGRAELLAVNRGTLNSYAYETPGAPWRFVRAVLQWPGEPSGQLLAGDLDGDGDQDLAFSSAVVFSWFERLDAVSFAAGRPLLSDMDPGPPDLMDPKLVALADFDGDEDLDVVYSVWREPRRA
jgi:hypothetical protein